MISKEEFYRIMGLTFAEGSTFNELTRDGVNPEFKVSIEVLNKAADALLADINENPLGLFDGSYEGKVENFRKAFEKMQIYANDTFPLELHKDTNLIGDTFENYKKGMSESVENFRKNFMSEVKSELEKLPEVKKYVEEQEKKKAEQKEEEKKKEEEQKKQEEKKKEEEQKQEDKKKKEEQEQEEKKKKEEQEKAANAKKEEKVEKKAEPKKKAKKASKKDRLKAKAELLRKRQEAEERELAPRNFSPKGLFEGSVNKLEAAGARGDSKEYSELLKMVKDINDGKVKGSEMRSPRESYVLQLIAIKSRINKYLIHKAETGVKQNSYKKLAAVEELNIEITRRLKNIKCDSFIHENKLVNPSKLVLSYEDEVKRFTKNFGKNIEKKPPSPLSDDIMKKWEQNAKTNYPNANVEEMKMVDACMCRIMLASHHNGKYGKNTEELGKMREQFRINPDNDKKTAKKTNSTQNKPKAHKM